MGRLTVGTKRTMFLMLGVTLGSLCIGCGADTGGRVPVAGKVTLDGQPLERGSIEFHPSGSDGTMTGSVIEDGEFSIPATQGAKPGSYSVKIYATGDTVEVEPDQPPGPEGEGAISEELIPPKYNRNTELTADIGDGGTEDLSFDLTSS